MNNNQDKRGVSQSKDVPSTCAVEGSFSCSSGSDEATSGPADASDDAPRSSQRQDIPEEAKAVPLGLGMGGLQLKVRYIIFVSLLYILEFIRRGCSHFR